MNRKQRINKWKRWGFVIKGKNKWSDIAVMTYADNYPDICRLSPVDVNRQSAKKRMLYHAKADWECLSGREGYCLSCKWVTKCKAIHPYLEGYLAAIRNSAKVKEN